MDLLVPILILTSIGLIAAVCLVIISNIMAVPKNEKLEQILEVLPGANCGACGFSGCEGYAKALSLGKAEIGLCSPGGKDVSQKLSEILKVEGNFTTPKKAIVRCCTSNNIKNTDLQYQGLKSCTAVSTMSTSSNPCDFGCIGFGDCAKVCQYGAISIKDGVAKIDPKKCVGCSKCVKTCPKNLITLTDDKKQAVNFCMNTDKGMFTRKACLEGCIGCMMCVKACPESSISMNQSLAVVDKDKCIDCGKCVAACKIGCIKLAFSQE